MSTGLTYPSEALNAFLRTLYDTFIYYIIADKLFHLNTQRKACGKLVELYLTTIT